MEVSEYIRLYKAFPNDIDIEGYLPIDGSIVRAGDIVYMEVNAPSGYGLAQLKLNGVEILPLPDMVEGRYRITIDNCNDIYTVVFGRKRLIDLSLTQDNTITHPVIFSN